MEEREVLNIKVDKGYGHKMDYKLYRKDIPSKLFKVLDCLIKGYISQLDVELSDGTASFKVSHKLGHTKILSLDKTDSINVVNLFLEEYRKKDDKYITQEINNDRLLNPIISKYFANNSKELREDVNALDNVDKVYDSIQFEGEIVDNYITVYGEYGIIGKCDIPKKLLEIINTIACRDYNIDTLMKIYLTRRGGSRYIKFKYEDNSISFSYMEGNDYISMYECKNIGKNVGYEEVSFYEGRNDNVVSVSKTIIEKFMKFFIDERSVFDDLIKSVVTH